MDWGTVGASSGYVLYILIPILDPRSPLLTFIIIFIIHRITMRTSTKIMINKFPHIYLSIGTYICLCLFLNENVLWCYGIEDDLIFKWDFSRYSIRGTVTKPELNRKDRLWKEDGKKCYVRIKALCGPEINYEPVSANIFFPVWPLLKNEKKI